MKKIAIFLIVTLLLLASTAVSGCGCNQKKEDVFSSANNMFMKLVETEGEDKAAVKTVKWLEKQPDVREAGIGSDCIYFYQEDGTVFVIDTVVPKED